jgi:hypothetical protein
MFPSQLNSYYVVFVDVVYVRTDHQRSCLLLVVYASLSTCTCFAYVSKSLLSRYSHPGMMSPIFILLFYCQEPQHPFTILCDSSEHHNS